MHNAAHQIHDHVATVAPTMTNLTSEDPLRAFDFSRSTIDWGIYGFLKCKYDTQWEF